MSKPSKKSSSPTTMHTDQRASQHRLKRRKVQRLRNRLLWLAVGGVLVVIIVAIGLLVFSPHTTQNGQPNLPNGSTISPQSLKQAIDAKGKITIVDVRTLQEYQTGHIKDSILLPLDTLASKASEVLFDKSQTLYVYCRTGHRSAQAVSFLLQLGYTNVHSLSGGITAWQNSGYPVVNS
jgi:rhodanese-related sulfurtransferase